MSILSYKKARKTYAHAYENGDYSYYRKDKFKALIRNGVDLLAGVNAIDCNSLPNKDYSYKTKDGICSIIRNGVDLLAGKNAEFCHCYDNYDGTFDYSYRPKGGFYVLMRNGVDLLAGKKVIYILKCFGSRENYVGWYECVLNFENDETFIVYK